ncbi:MAG TPA: hypothetical protein VF200_03685 [Woeseiaceae bacterium]
MVHRRALFCALTFLLPVSLASPRFADAMPAFARAYNISCTVCHAAFPRLSPAGEMFANEWNFRMPNWQQTALELGDDRLFLPKQLPLGLRAQGFVQARDGESIDPVTGEVAADSRTDVQAPYLIKLLASAPLSEQISFYFYAIFAEKGGNGEVVVEDAWFSYGNLFDTGISLQLGQFQISDLMFPREVRLTFQDFMLYRLAGITYERGVLFGRDVGAFQVDLGFVNGNGIDANASLNSPGFRRADRLFDNDTSKTVFGRVATDFRRVNVGLFGLAGEQRNAEGPAGTLTGDRDTDKRVLGVDVSGELEGGFYWFAQALWNEWDGFLDPAQSYEWYGAFAGIDWVRNERWTHSILYNYADAKDFDGTNTVFEGIDISSLTFSASYYFMRNVKGVIELNVDLLSTKVPSGPFFTGHLSHEHYFLVGFDAAF